MSTTLYAQEGPVKYRQSVMQAIGGHAGAIAQIAYGGVEYKDHLAGHVLALQVLSKQVVPAFQAEVITEDPPTRAKEEIWSRWSEFEQHTNDFQESVAAVAKTAEGGDLGALATSLDPLWDTCKGCHKPFRKKPE